MDNQFQHFIITRFNVRLKREDIKSLPSEQWQEERFQLFEKFSLPSMKNQSKQNFKWFIFFDKETPEQFIGKIEEYKKQFKIIAIFTDEFNINEIKSEIAPYLSIEIPYLITTRIDNDDTFSSDFIESIQRTFAYQNLEYINFPKGYVLKGNRLYNHIDKSGPFISLIEKKDYEIKTVWCTNHRDVSQVAPIQQVDNKIWMQIVHKNNVSNRIKSYRLNKIELKDRFIIEKKHENKISIALENLTIYPIRYTLELAGMIVKFLIRLSGREKFKRRILQIIKKVRI